MATARARLPLPVPAIENITVRTADGVSLAGRFYRAAAAPNGAVLIVPAMGVPQTFYAKFAHWLAAHGFATVTFDYRGTGASRHRSLRTVDADIQTWAEQDTAAVLRELQTRTPGLPITWIGHSLGGQIVPFVREHASLAKVITIAAGSGYWRENARALRRRVWMLWWLAVPLLTPLFGYFPGKALGMVGDLPRGVVRQWRRWCLQRDYAVGDGEHVRALYAAVTRPVTAFSFTDDEMMSATNVESLHGFYINAPLTMRRLSPHEVGVRRIGHFGFFRAEMTGPLWERRLLRELAR